MAARPGFYTARPRRRSGAPSGPENSATAECYA
jgi:hypothetical protein